MYELLIERSAEKDLQKLSAEYSTKITSKIKELASTPRPPGCRKIINSENYWRLRIGNYRIIYEILDVQKTIRIYRIKHRKDAYR